MAEFIAKLRVDSKQYEAKIERARSGLLALEKNLKETGKDFTQADKDQVEFIKHLGQMDTVSRTAAGRVNELTKAFTDLTIQYKKLSDVEKQGEAGKALQASLGQLKTRIIDAKAELKDVQVEINGTENLFGSLASKLGVSTQMLSGFGAAAAALAGVAKLMGDAFKNNEDMMDEWGRTVQSAQAVYSGFLNALNNSDISGFLNRIQDIVSAAREAYDAMDELTTYTAFNQRNVAKSRAAYAQALDEYRLNPTKENKAVLEEANNRVMQDLRESHDMTEDAYQKALQSIARDNLNTKELQEAFVRTFSEGSYADLKAAIASYSTGTGLNAGAQYWNGNHVYNGRIDMSGASQSGQWREMTDIEKQQFEFARALHQISEQRMHELQSLGAQSIAIQEQIYQQDRAYNRLAGNNKPLSATTNSEVVKTEEQLNAAEIEKLTQEYITATDERKQAIQGEIKVLQDRNAEIKKLKDEAKGITAPLILPAERASNNYSSANIASLRSQLQKELSNISLGTDDYLIAANQIADLNAFENLLKVAMQNGIEFNQARMQMMFDDIRLGVDVPDDEIIKLKDEIQEQLSGISIDVDLNTGAVKTASTEVKGLKTDWTQAAQAVAAFGSALQSVEDPTAKVAGIIAEAIASVAAGAGGAIAQASNGSAGGPWGWLAFAISATATMVSTIAAIKTATSSGKYAEGGVVGGNSYNGDKLMAWVNSGETILNQNQAGRVLEGLRGSAVGTGNLELTTKVSGEDLMIILNNTNRARGGSRGYYSNVH